MQLTAFFTVFTLAASVSAIALSESRTSSPSCPAENPNYCGWFDKVKGIPPTCKAPIPNPKPMKKPTCPRGQAAYCAIDPGHFCPYDPAHKFCLDTGVGRCDCFDVHLSVTALQRVLGDLFCTVEKAVTLLGFGCLLNSGSCRSDWIRLDLGCTPAELLVLVKNAVCTVVSLLGGLLGIFGRL